jgi:hypothetical protein
VTCSSNGSSRPKRFAKNSWTHDSRPRASTSTATESKTAPSGTLDGWVRVRSGVDGRELWSSHDPLEYESKDRLTPLGDLDGDGFAELAVLHPRRDRSRYDWELLDLAFGAKSRLSIVFGSRVARR